MNLLTIFFVLFPIMSFQKCFFTQNLPVEEPDTCKKIDKEEPIGEDEEKSNQLQSKCNIERIAAHRKRPMRNQLIWSLLINSYPET